MKALSIKQPWASLIANGIKDIENRTWRTNFRGRIYIHASAKPFMGIGQTFTIYTKEQHDAIHLKHDELVLKAYFETSQIIGEVDIIDCVINHPSIWAEKTFTYEYDESGEKPIGKPIYNWVLSNPVLYEKPILNVKGKLSFWEPDIDINECIGCSEKFNLTEMLEDSAGELYCKECADVLFPIMRKEYEEMLERGEIEPEDN